MDTDFAIHSNMVDFLPDKKQKKVKKARKRQAESMPTKSERYKATSNGIKLIPFRRRKGISPISLNKGDLIEVIGITKNQKHFVVVFGDERFFLTRKAMSLGFEPVMSSVDGDAEAPEEQTPPAAVADAPTSVPSTPAPAAPPVQPAEKKWYEKIDKTSAGLWGAAGILFALVLFGGGAKKGKFV